MRQQLPIVCPDKCLSFKTMYLQISAVIECSTPPRRIVADVRTKVQTVTDSQTQAFIRLGYVALHFSAITSNNNVHSHALRFLCHL